LKKFSLYILVVVLSNLFAQELTLSEDRQNILNYSKSKIKEDSSKLKTDWINSITYSYTQNDGDTTDKSEKSLIYISQPIFKSGGIYSAIKYATSLKNSNSIAISLEEKELIKTATNVLFNIYKNDLLIQKQKLIIKNNLIDIKQKEQSVLNGILDISSLNNAILDSNKQKENLLELKFQHTNLVNTFHSLTAADYRKFQVPKLKLLTKNLYIQNNIYIKQSKANTDVKKHLANMTIAKYLPTVNANYTYTNNHTENSVNDTYGFSVVIPFNIGSINDISSSKLDVLKSKAEEKITMRSEKNFLDTRLAKLDMLNKKIELTKQNIESFNSILSQMKELEKGGLKTKDDVAVLENSKKAESLDTKIFSIDRQIELLELYARVTNEI
jgi:outer membrane protein TolC